MINQRTPKLAASFLALAMAAALLTASPAAADAAASAATTADSGIGEGQTVRAEPSQQLRTTTGAMVERPAFTYTACPELTDSITRLYSAYFLRAPDAGGFDFWMTEYSAGNWSLPRMSTFFSQSDEFQEMYGDVSDAEFINLIYLNIFGREADIGGRDFWLGRMQNEGMNRGTVMLNFSESPEYVQQSGTVRSLAGDFNWYPEGATWECGFGFTEFEIPASGTYLDLAIYNNGRGSMQFSVNQRRGGNWENAVSDQIEPGMFYIFFGVPLVDAPIDRVQVGGNSDDLGWIVVRSPEVLPRERAGWTAV